MNKKIIKISAFIMLAIFAGSVFYLKYSPDVGTVEITNTEPSTMATSEVHENPSPFVYTALIIMSIATLLSTFISFYLYKWRRILLSQPNLLVPEEWGKYLDAVGKNLNMLETSFLKSISDIATKTSENSARISNMTDTYMSLQNALDEKDSEIRRFKKGYDAEIYRKYLLRFIRIDQTIDDYIYTSNGDSNHLEQLKRLFEDALDECGVERFAPQKGEDYRQAFGVADNPKKVLTEKTEEDFLIAEILEFGYKLHNGDDYQIIVPSKVSIYRVKD